MHRYVKGKLKLSYLKAATLVGLSDARLRQIANGYAHVNGQKYPVVAPDDTLARIAVGLGIRPEELVAAGRDAAGALVEAWESQHGWPVDRDELGPGEEEPSGLDARVSNLDRQVDAIWRVLDELRGGGGASVTPLRPRTAPPAPPDEAPPIPDDVAADDSRQPSQYELQREAEHGDDNTGR